MRRRKILRISVEDVSRLHTLASHSFSTPALISIIAGVLIVSMLLGASIIAFTPLRTFIPGYFRDSQRQTTEEAILKIDSLQSVVQQNEIYLANVKSVLNPANRVSDSLQYAGRVGVVSVDSLLPKSAEETKFASMMQEREKFNIEVIASMAADGMLMYPVCDEGIVTKDSRDSYTISVSLPARATLMAIADGVVIGSYYDSSIRSYVLLTQHDNGFVSRIEGIGSPMIGQSDIVTGGEIISSSPSVKSGAPSIVKISLWHNGIPVKPYEYVMGHRYRLPSSQEVKKTFKTKNPKDKSAADSISLRQVNSNNP